MDSTVVAAVLAFLAAYTVVLLVILVVEIIAMWKLFVKTGEPGWKSLIPFYNGYVYYKAFWNVKMFWVLLGAAFASGIFQQLIRSGNDSLIVSLLSLAASIVILVIYVMTCSKVAKAFGKGTGFTVGLVFLHTIFTMVLAFGSDEYIGNES